MDPISTFPAEQAPLLLLVDEVDRARLIMARVLQKQGYRVAEAATAQEALDIASNTDVDVALVDLHLGHGMEGLKLIQAMGEQCPEVQCIVITNRGGARETLDSLQSGACDYFEKPISDWTRFGQVIRKAIEIRRIQGAKERADEVGDRLSTRLQRALGDEIVGRSPAMLRLGELIRRIARVRVPVLITGESGVGKELVARALHAQAPWAHRPFMDINCAAIPPNLIESELFGHERGAFTGATQRKLGLFEVAEDGTIFLDEIGELPMDLQAKLLRVLQEGQFRRVGGTRSLPNEARVVSATNKSLKQLVRESRFREDLLYRLNLFEVEVPPLRERKDDIPLLTWFFVEKYNAEHGKRVRRIPDEVMRLLKTGEYRENNVRQLQHQILRAMVLAEGESLDVDLFEARGRLLSDVMRRDAPGESLPRELAALPYKEAKDRVVGDFSKVYLLHRLSQAGGNISQAAIQAGVERPNFRKLLKRFGIQTVYQARHGEDEPDTDE
jgi:DNA-binding NtrC family response regulator